MRVRIFSRVSLCLVLLAVVGGLTTGCVRREKDATGGGGKKTLNNSEAAEENKGKPISRNRQQLLEALREAIRRDNATEAASILNEATSRGVTLLYCGERGSVRGEDLVDLDDVRLISQVYPVLSSAGAQISAKKKEEIDSKVSTERHTSRKNINGYVVGLLQPRDRGKQKFRLEELEDALKHPDFEPNWDGDGDQQVPFNEFISCDAVGNVYWFTTVNALDLSSENSHQVGALLQAARCNIDQVRRRQARTSTYDVNGSVMHGVKTADQIAFLLRFHADPNVANLEGMCVVHWVVHQTLNYFSFKSRNLPILTKLVSVGEQT